MAQAARVGGLSEHRRVLSGTTDPPSTSLRVLLPDRCITFSARGGGMNSG